MFVEKIKSDGLAHLSYLVGDGVSAAVIDPRRDCEVYIDEAARRGCRIEHIFETHRNEDFVCGAPILARMTGATVHHGPHADGEVRYARTLTGGDSFTLGSLRIDVLETPGHTRDSVSLALYDQDAGGPAVGVFTGDALFVGDVGRTDFYPGEDEKVAGQLFDSLKKITALGDQAILYPAHGAGSVCGGNMADREFSTLGFERQTNPMLQIADRDDFIARKVAEHHDQPPYFRLMERLNLEGGAPIGGPLAPRPLDAESYARAAEGGVVIDVRSISAFAGAHLPGSLALPAAMVPSFAGWLVDPETPLVLVADNAAQAETAARHLARIGYDGVRGALTAPFPAWTTAAKPFASLAGVDVGTVAQRVADPAEDWTLLDVRSQAEVEQGVIEGSVHHFLGELPGHLDQLDPYRRYTVMCASGARATVAASLLLRAGFHHVDVFMGSMAAWKAAGNETTASE